MIHRLAFAFWAPDEDGDDGNVSFPPGEGVEAIILLQRKSKISMAGLLVCFLLCFFIVFMTSWRGILFCNTRNQLKIPLQEVLYAIFYEIQFKMTASFKISIFILLISYLQFQPNSMHVQIIRCTCPCHRLIYFKHIFLF